MHGNMNIKFENMYHRYIKVYYSPTNAQMIVL